MTMRHSFEHGMFVRDYRPEGGGPVLVWIHGLGESGLCFEHVVGEPELADRHCIVPDLPGEFAAVVGEILASI
jgi:pimeloyl-ACP methyl ester carboxylesterase